MPEIYYFLSAEQYQPEILVNHAQLAEKAGFDGVMISDHFNPWVADGSAAGFSFTTLGAIAQSTQRIKLMTYVTTPLWRYSPPIIAQAAATIDRLSDGRFELGIGMGRAHDEVAAGFVYPAYSERNQRMREAIKIIKRLLDGGKVTFKGDFYQTKDAKLYSAPISKIPIYLAGGAPKTSKLAGEMCDGLIISVKDIEDTINSAISPAKAENDNLEIIASKWLLYANDQKEAWKALCAQRGLRAQARNTETDPAQLQAEVDNMTQEEVLRNYTTVAKPEEIVSHYKPLITQLSANKIGIQIGSTNQEQLIDKLGEHVIPTLRRS